MGANSCIRRGGLLLLGRPPLAAAVSAFAKAADAAVDPPGADHDPVFAAAVRTGDPPAFPTGVVRGRRRRSRHAHPLRDWMSESRKRWFGCIADGAGWVADCFDESLIGVETNFRGAVKPIISQPSIAAPTAQPTTQSK